MGALKRLQDGETDKVPFHVRTNSTKKTVIVIVYFRGMPDCRDISSICNIRQKGPLRPF